MTIDKTKITAICFDIDGTLRDTDDQYVEKLEKILGHYPKELLHINVINAHNEERGIEMFLKTNKCDLMAIVTHGRSGLTPLYRRSITEALINHLEIPVLSLNT